MKHWPADNVERWPISKLIPHARNSRTHSSEQVDQIAASIREWGWTDPILVTEEGTIIAGHGRVLGAKKFGLTEAPVMVASGWSNAQIQAYALADNKLALNAGWDAGMLALEIADLQELGFDLDLTGFLADEIAALSTSQQEELTDRLTTRPSHLPNRFHCRATCGGWEVTGSSAAIARCAATSRPCWAA